MNLCAQLTLAGIDAMLEEIERDRKKGDKKKQALLLFRETLEEESSTISEPKSNSDATHIGSYITNADRVILSRR